MALRPSEQHERTNRPRDLNESDRNRLRKEKDKADFYRRNPHRKWNDR